LLPGVHKPDATNTGPYTVTTFVEVLPAAGSNTITVAPGDYTGRRYWGIVKASGPVTFRECVFPGPDPTSWTIGQPNNPSYGCTQNYGSNPPLMKFYDCLHDPGLWLTTAAPTQRTSLNPYNIGHHGGQAEFYRCEMLNVSDGINFIGASGSIAAANAHHFTLQQSWIHKCLYVNDMYPPNDGQLHCDAFQSNYGKNVLIWGNTLGGVRVPSGYNVWPGNTQGQAGQGFNAGDDFWNSCFMLKQESLTVAATDPRFPDVAAIARLENFVIKENWLSGGTCSMNIASDTKYDTTGVCYSSWQISGNRFATRGADWGQTMRGFAKGDGGTTYNSGAGQYILRSATRYGGTLTGSVNEQTGLPVPISAGG
jgi:hypothetical protein